MTVPTVLIADMHKLDLAPNIKPGYIVAMEDQWFNFKEDLTGAKLFKQMLIRNGFAKPLINEEELYE